MAAPSHSERIAFGPFEVDATTGELRKRGLSIRLSGQPFRILVLLLRHPGELVSQEQLKEEIWQDGTFVDFEHGLYAAMNKLRRALNDSAENPRYIETVPGRGYRFIGVLERANPRPIAPVALTLVGEEEGRVEPAQTRPRRGLWWLAAGACLLVAVAAGWRLLRPASTPPIWKLTQLTSDAWRSDSPALSRDGKLVAYSAERNGARDLFIRQVTGSQSIQLTFDGLGNTSPDFSPDGSKIVFRSSRDGGGIYEMPAFGGEARLLAHGGLRPKYSPDGAQVAFWIGDYGVNPMVPGNGSVWVIPSSGGSPVRVGSQFTTARAPVWSPDGRNLLIVGYQSEKTYDASALDWWLVSTETNAATRIRIREALLKVGLESPGADGVPLLKIPGPIALPDPACWLSAGNRVILPARAGDAGNIWETQLSPEGNFTGTFQRLTAGSGNEVNVSCASADTLAFASSETSGNVWFLPFDLIRGKPAGAAEQITRQPSALREEPSISADGRQVVFSSIQSGLLNVWWHNAATGTENQVAASPFVQRYPAISPSGKRVAYSSYEKDKRILYVASPGGVPEKLCEGCLRPTDWSRDENALLTFGGNPYRVSLLDLASHQQTPLLSHPTYNLLYAHFSPDNRWISFTARVTPNRSWIMIAPIDGPRRVPESSWIKISEEAVEDSAAWSPDGKTLYFTSGRDGHVCLWAQRIEPKSHQPSGDSFAVQHFHERPLTLGRQWSSGGGRIAVTLMESSGNIWLMSRSAER